MHHYLKINDYLNTLDEKQQKSFSQVINLAIILIPIFCVLIFLFSNFQSKNEISIKEQIIEQITEFDSSNNSLNYLSSALISQTPIASENDLDNQDKTI